VKAGRDGRARRSDPILRHTGASGGAQAERPGGAGPRTREAPDRST